MRKWLLFCFMWMSVAAGLALADMFIEPNWTSAQVLLFQCIGLSSNIYFIRQCDAENISSHK